MVIFNEMKHVSPAGLGKQQLINAHAGNVAVFSLLSELLFLLRECRCLVFRLFKVHGIRCCVKVAEVSDL